MRGATSFRSSGQMSQENRCSTAPSGRKSAGCSGSSRASAWPALLLAASLASSCATSGGIPTPAELATAANSRFAGRDVAAVIARYGPPDSQFTQGEIRVLEWRTTGTLRFHEPVTTTTTGSVGDPAAYPFLASVPYRETTTTTQGYNVDYACTMQVGVRPDGRVDRVGFGGKMGACQQFMP